MGAPAVWHPQQYFGRQSYLIQVDPSQRIVLIGGPRVGKSRAARQYRYQGLPTFCCDPLSMVKDQEPDVTYLPEGLSWSEGSQFVCDHWLTMQTPFCIEGVSAVRALRKWTRPEAPADRIVVFRMPHPLAATLLRGQRAMGLGVSTIWASVEPRFADLVEYR